MFVRIGGYLVNVNAIVAVETDQRVSGRRIVHLPGSWTLGVTDEEWPKVDAALRELGDLGPPSVVGKLAGKGTPHA